jgi:hypothetical protein
MKFLNQKVIFFGLFLFILIHVILGENGTFTRQNQDILPLGLNPSIAHDSFSTRNPAIEEPFGVLVDLPGGYSFYLSPIFITIPLISGSLINGFPLPQITEITNPSDIVLTQLQFQQLLFFFVSGVLLIVAGFWFLRNRIIRRRKKL